MDALKLEPIETPCIKVCTLDPAAGLCLGCGRTLAEIGGWMRMSAAERALAMAQLPDRLARTVRRAKGE